MEVVEQLLHQDCLYQWWQKKTKTNKKKKKTRKNNFLWPWTILDLLQDSFTKMPWAQKFYISFSNTGLLDQEKTYKLKHQKNAPSFEHQQHPRKSTCARRPWKKSSKENPTATGKQKELSEKKKTELEFHCGSALFAPLLAGTAFKKNKIHVSCYVAVVAVKRVPVVSCTCERKRAATQQLTW